MNGDQYAGSRSACGRCIQRQHRELCGYAACVASLPMHAEKLQQMP